MDLSQDIKGTLDALLPSSTISTAVPMDTSSDISTTSSAFTTSNTFTNTPVVPRDNKPRCHLPKVTPVWCVSEVHTVCGALLSNLTDVFAHTTKVHTLPSQEMTVIVRDQQALVEILKFRDLLLRTTGQYFVFGRKVCLLMCVYLFTTHCLRVCDTAQETEGQPLGLLQYAMLSAYHTFGAGEAQHS